MITQKYWPEATLWESSVVLQAARKSNQFTFIFPLVIGICAQRDQVTHCRIWRYFVLFHSTCVSIWPLEALQSQVKCQMHPSSRQMPSRPRSPKSWQSPLETYKIDYQNWWISFFYTELSLNYSHRRWLKILDLAGIYGSWERVWGKEGAEMREDVTPQNIALALETNTNWN